MLKLLFCWMVWLIAFTGFSSEICVCVSIAKNEKNLERCLESIKEIADYILVYDEGFSEETVEVVKDFLLKTQIPGMIEKPPSKDLNQLLPIESAQRFVVDQLASKENIYILFIESSMILKTTPEFSREMLGKSDCYLLLEKTSQFSSYQPHLISSKSESIGSTIKKCPGLILEKQSDLRRELEQWSSILVQKENQERSLFEMAKIYQELQQYEMAIQTYSKRLQTKGDFEEFWFSTYMMGACYEKLGQWEEALFWYLQAYEKCPHRADPLAKIATHYRLLGYNDLAYIFSKFGSSIPFLEDQLHFTSFRFEPYQFEEELSIVSYYTPFKEDGYRAASNLVLKRGVPYSIRHQTYCNLLYYVQPLEKAVYFPIEINLPWVRENIPYRPMNPSILKTTEGYDVICRTVNYTQTGAKDFQTYDDLGVYRSKNFLLRYDREFDLLEQKEIIDESFHEKFGCSRVQGFEDCRIFELNQQLCFTCTTTDTNPTGSFQISFCEIGASYLENYAPVEFLQPLKGPDPYRCEKNWLPFIEDGQLKFVYQYDPFTIYQADLKTGDCTKTYQYQPQYDFSSFRGSAGPVDFDGGRLILVHEVVFQSDGQRSYLHRFVFLSRDWVVMKFSKPFVFKHVGVEYCCGMSLDHSGDKMLLPIGIEDREAFICRVDCETIRSMLH